MNDSEYVKVEKAKILKSIIDSGIIEKDYLSIKKILLTSSDNETAIDSVIKGLTEEDEFALISRLMGTTTHLIPLEQRPIILGDYIVPDFLARLQPSCVIAGFSKQDSSGFTCLIEIKSTWKNKLKFGGFRLRRLRNFADQFGLPLLLAVRFLIFGQNAVWAIVEDSNRTVTSLTVTIEQMVFGIRHVLWDEYWYMLLPGTHFVGVFDRDHNEPGVTNPKYGTQKEFKIISGDRVLSFTGGEATIYSAFFEAFLLEEAGIQEQGSVTYQALVPSLLVCSMVDAVYKFNHLPQDEQGQTIYDASKMIAQPKSDLFDIGFIDKVAQSLIDKEVLFIMGSASPEAHLQKWRQFGGLK
jgi:hypothetical protein